MRIFGVFFIMNETIAAVPAVEYPEFPRHWVAESRDMATTILEKHPALDGAGFALLVSIGELITTACELEEIARTEGFVTEGSAGQKVVNPALSEARACRAEADRHLSRLIPASATADDDPNPADVGRQLARRRWSK
jgi:hypothetical protein